MRRVGCEHQQLVALTIDDSRRHNALEQSWRSLEVPNSHLMTMHSSRSTCLEDRIHDCNHNLSEQLLATNLLQNRSVDHLDLAIACSQE